MRQGALSSERPKGRRLPWCRRPPRSFHHRLPTTLSVTVDPSRASVSTVILSNFLNIVGACLDPDSLCPTPASCNASQRIVCPHKRHGLRGQRAAAHNQTQPSVVTSKWPTQGKPMSLHPVACLCGPAFDTVRERCQPGGRRDTCSSDSRQWYRQQHAPNPQRSRILSATHGPKGIHKRAIGRIVPVPGRRGLPDGFEDDASVTVQARS